MLPEEYNEPIDRGRQFGVEISRIAKQNDVVLDGVLLMQELLGTQRYKLPRPDYLEKLEELKEEMNAILEQKISKRRDDIQSQLLALEDIIYDKSKAA